MHDNESQVWKLSTEHNEMGCAEVLSITLAAQISA